MFPGREARGKECFVACWDRKEREGDEGLESGFSYWNDEPGCVKGGPVSEIGCKRDDGGKESNIGGLWTENERKMENGEKAYWRYCMPFGGLGCRSRGYWGSWGSQPAERMRMSLGGQR